MLYVFDLSCWVYRYYATMKGRAAHGFNDFMGKVLRTQRPAYVAVCADLPFPTFRHDIAPNVYKAQRAPKDGTLLERLRWSREFIEDFHGVHVYSERGYEADDLIAAVTKRAVAAGMRVVIVGLDKDLLQLVSRDVVMWDGKTEARGPEHVRKKFRVEPHQLGDFLAIVGDKADNIAGLPGAGPKFAAEVLAAFGSLDRAFAATGILEPIPPLFQKRPRYRDLLIDGCEDAKLSQRLTALCDTMPIEFSKELLAYAAEDA